VPQPDNVYQWVVLGSAANLAQRFRNFDDNAAKWAKCRSEDLHQVVSETVDKKVGLLIW